MLVKSIYFVKIWVLGSIPVINGLTLRVIPS